MINFHSLAAKCNRVSQKILFVKPMGSDPKPATISIGPHTCSEADIDNRVYGRCNFFFKLFSLILNHCFNFFVPITLAFGFNPATIASKAESSTVLHDLALLITFIVKFFNFVLQKFCQSRRFLC